MEPVKGQIVWIAQPVEGGSLPYRVTDVRHEPGSGIWTYDLEPVADDDPELLSYV